MATSVTPEQFRVALQQAEGSPLLVAISGFGGAGKSTLAGKLATELDGAVVVHVDDFIVDQLSKRCDDWSSIDRKRLIEQVLEPTRSSGECRYQRYDWPTNSLAEWNALSDFKYLIVEGIGLIHPETTPLFDITAWVDVPLELAEQRGKYRDKEIYKVDHDALWEGVWTPNERDYLERFQPTTAADFLVSSTDR